MIKAFLTGLWLMSFLAVRFPLKMLPIFFFEFLWNEMRIGLRARTGNS